MKNYTKPFGMNLLFLYPVYAAANVDPKHVRGQSDVSSKKRQNIH